MYKFVSLSTITRNYFISSKMNDLFDCFTWIKKNVKINERDSCIFTKLFFILNAYCNILTQE